MCLKSSLILLLSVFVSPLAFATDYTADANCKVAYLYTEGSGTTVADASGNSNTGTFQSLGNPAWSTTLPTGYSNYSVQFTPGTDNISIPDRDYFTFSGAESIVLWGNQDDTNSKWWITKGNASNYEWALLLDGSDHMDFIIWDLSGTEQYNVSVTGSSQSSATWYHYGLVKSTADGKFYYYINGVQNSATSTTTSSNGTSTVMIGGRSDGGGTYYKGYQTQNAIFNRELSSTEINDIKDNGLRPAATRRIWFIS